MDSTPRQGRTLAACALLAGAAAIAYLPALRAGFVWDDGTFLTDNPLIKAADGLRRFWFTAEASDYWPVTSTSLWVEWRLWGMHALGYHATNLALHIAECLLLWAVLRRLVVPGAFLAAYPVRGPSSECRFGRVDCGEKKLDGDAVLPGVDLVLLKFDPVPIRRPVRRSLGEGGSPTGEGGSLAASRSSPFFYGLSLLAFALGMLSKGSVAVLPVVLLGIILWHRRPDRRDVVRLAPFFAVGGGLALVNVWFQGHDWHDAVRGASGLERMLKAGAQVWFYLFKALAPVNLMFVYPEWPVRAADPRWWGRLLAAVARTAWLWR